jgi:hypothetical protein
MERGAEVGFDVALGVAAGNPVQLRQTGDVVVHEGDEWIVPKCEQRIKAQMEQWCKKNAQHAIAEEVGESRREMQREYIAMRSAGHYTWDGDVVRDARNSYQGQVYLFYLLLRRAHGEEATEAKAKEVFDAELDQVAPAMQWSLGNGSAPPPNQTKRQAEEQSRSASQSS